MSDQDPGQTDESTPDDMIASMLAVGASQEMAGAAAGVTARTVRRRLADPAFVARVQEYRRQIADQTTGLLAKYSAGVASTLARLALDPAQPPTVRIAAGKIVLDKLASLMPPPAPPQRHEHVHLDPAAVEQRKSEILAELAAAREAQNTPNE